MKRYLLPIGAGVVVFGVATAFAASLTVNSKSLGSGNTTVAACNSSATVAYTTAAITSGTNKGKYQVTGGTLTTVAGSPSVCSGKSYQVTLLDGSNNVLGTEATGTLGTNGDATMDFSGTEVLASAVSNIAVTITG